MASQTIPLPAPGGARLAPERAAQLSALFRALGNGTRLRMLHALAQAGELRVGDLCLTLAMKPQAVSNQLRRLAEQGFLTCRRQGTHMFYRISDPCIARLLDNGLCLLNDLATSTLRRAG